jgi:class 3 adenylate cyclase
LKKIYMQSLQQRLVVFLLSPVTALLLAGGFIGFRYARAIILDQWQTTAAIKLERAAHDIEMRMKKPIEWIDIFHRSGRMNLDYPTQEWILDQLKHLDGVAQAHIEWVGGDSETFSEQADRKGILRKFPFRHGRVTGISKPVFNADGNMETVSIHSALTDDNDAKVADLWVNIRFDYLMADIQKLGWLQLDQAFLVDRSGRFLFHTATFGERHSKLGETGVPFERKILEGIQEKRFGILFDAGRPPRTIAGFHNIDLTNWTVVLIAPGRVILKQMYWYRNLYFLGVGIMVLIVLGLLRVNLIRIIRPIRAISQAAREVARGVYETPAIKKTGDEIGQLAESFEIMVAGLKQRDHIRNTFGRYVDYDFAQKLIKHPEKLRLGGDKREVVILVIDIRNFTPLSETLSPERTIELLNRFFSAMITVIHRHQGIIVDFVGDSLLVFFDSLEDPVDDAITGSVACALNMQEELDRLNLALTEDHYPVLETGIGIHLGPVVVGNIGSEVRAKYGIVGAAVNLAHRIQSCAASGEIVLSKSMLQALPAGYNVSRPFVRQLKGIKDPVELYKLQGIDPRYSGT